MSREFKALPPDLAQTRPGLGVLRLAALFAEEHGEPDEDALDAMFELVEADALAAAASSEMWPELVRGLMAPHPARLIRSLRDCGALTIVLPEVAALFGVPQISADLAEVDIGAHLLDALTEAARADAPLEVRFALLTMNVGKSDSPREHLPVHYRHIERGRSRIEAICARFGAPARCLDLALLALTECERVHRVSEVRAGPVAAMLERLGAFDAPDTFALLMSVCACDFRAHGSGSGQAYHKAALLETALRACAQAAEAQPADPGAESADAAQMARAAAIAQAFRSERWSGEG